VLSHRLIGELIGARRPTVSTALADLAREGELERRDDGTWLLTGEPVSVTTDSAVEVIRQRRRLMPTPLEELEAELPEPVAAGVGSERGLALRASLEAARAAADQHRRDFDTLLVEMTSLRERTVELRNDRQEHLRRLREAAARRRDG
jgi:hypothetical protein